MTEENVLENWQKIKLIQTRRKELEEMVIKSIEERCAVFSDINKPLNQKTPPSNPLKDLLEKSPEFNNLIEFLDEACKRLKLPEMIKSVGKYLDGFIEKDSSDPFGIKKYNRLNLNVIKFNPEENLVEQLKRHNIDLELVENKFMNHARYLDKNIPQFELITLPGNIIFNLDISKYERDKAQREAPPPGPQESNQKQPALGPIKGILRKPAKSFFAEQNSENQESSFEKNTPLDIPNLLPQKISGFKSHFADGPPLGPQKTSEQPVAEGPQKREKSDAHQEKGVTWANKMEQVRFIPGRESPGR
jgi:hypothetical protein